MSSELWQDVDHYLERACSLTDPALARALETSAAGGLPSISVSPCQGMLLHLLARAARAENILEIGTLGAFSTIYLARALGPGGRLLSLELNPAHARIAQENVGHAGVADRVEIRVGPALDALPALHAAGTRFDFFFVDADKENIAAYFNWCVRLARPRAQIVIDNVIRDGDILNAGPDDPRVVGVRRFFDTLAGDRRIRATAIQTVGVKGYDGFALAVVEG